MVDWNQYQGSGDYIVGGARQETRFRIKEAVAKEGGNMKSA